MAIKRGKSQARRHHGTGLPGWAWLVLGLVLGIGLILAAPRLLKDNRGDGFFRPLANPDAQPAASVDDEAVVPEDAGDGANTAAPGAGKPKETQFDFYTLLPGKEVVMSDAELAASARAEAQRQLVQDATTATPAQTATPSATTTVDGPAASTTDATPATPDTAPPPAATTAKPVGDNRYILQAGAFAASGDAEALKARIALLGLGARVESASINGKTIYRVRMGPYGTASELAEAKQALGNGGLPALPIRVK